MKSSGSLGSASQTLSKLGVVLGDYAVVGANSSIKPGTVVGSRTIIGEGVVAHGIYESNQTVTLSQALEIKPRQLIIVMVKDFDIVSCRCCRVS